MPLSKRQYAYLDAMGIDVWAHKDNVVAASSDTAAEQVKPVAAEAAVAVTVPPAREPVVQPVHNDLSSMDWPTLSQAIKTCSACELHQTRSQAVVGVGNQNADWMIIGEAPGADEDRQGEPFVGRAGQLLNAMLNAIGLQRQQVYIANILKCRPPNNRDPKPEEASQCFPYLHRQIELIQPKLILAVGRIAAQRLLDTQSNLGRLRQKVHWLEPHQIPVIVTYHPAYLLRSPTEKRKAWEDLLFAQRELQRL